MKVTTTVGLIIVGVTVTGLGVAWVVPTCGCTTKQKVYVSTMKSDLRNLVTAQESYFADNWTYSATILDSLYAPSQNVTVTIGAATSEGWNATAVHELTETSCSIYVGEAEPPFGGPLRREKSSAGITPAKRHRAPMGPKWRRSSPEAASDWEPRAYCRTWSFRRG